MVNSTVSIFIRFKSGGKRRTAAAAYAGKARLKPGIGKHNGKEIPCPAGVYWLRWYDGPKQVWQRVGFDPNDALKAQTRQEAILAGRMFPWRHRRASLARPWPLPLRTSLQSVQPEPMNEG